MHAAVTDLYLLVLNKVLVFIVSLYMRLKLDQPDRGMYSQEYRSHTESPVRMRRIKLEV